jgi:putative ABC transport system substrate-binding protein
LQLLKETIPLLSRVAVLHNGAFPTNRAAARRIVAAGSTMGVTVQVVSVKTPGELEGAFAAMAEARADAFIVTVNRMMSAQRKRIVALAAKLKLPAMCWQKELTRIGCLMSYGAERIDMVRRSASHVHKILRGAKPGDIPVEQPTKFEFVVNLRTAKALGIKVPRSILLRATEVIE